MLTVYIPEKGDKISSRRGYVFKENGVGIFIGISFAVSVDCIVFNNTSIRIIPPTRIVKGTIIKDEHLLYEKAKAYDYATFSEFDRFCITCSKTNKKVSHEPATYDYLDNDDDDDEWY